MLYGVQICTGCQNSKKLYLYHNLHVFWPLEFEYNVQGLFNTIVYNIIVKYFKDLPQGLELHYSLLESIVIGTELINPPCLGTGYIL